MKSKNYKTNQEKQLFGNDIDICNNCTFFEGFTSRCKRFPPTVLDKNGTSAFPVINNSSSDNCGEFQHNFDAD